MKKEVYMKHNKHFDELLMLYFYDELTKTERAGFKNHLDGCPICQQELSRLQAVEKRIACVPEPAPKSQLLSELNRRIMLEVAGDIRRPAWGRFKDIIDELTETISLSLAKPRYQLITVGMTFLIGILVGKLWLSSGLRHDPEMLANLVNYNYRFTDPEKEDIQKAFAGYLLKSGGVEAADLLHSDYRTDDNGIIEVNVKVDKNMAIRGGLDDPIIRNMLMYAARHDQSAERRLRAVRLLGQILPNPDVEATLIAVMLHDSDVSARLLAAELLDELAMTEQRLEAYKSVALRDSSTVLRSMALENLVRQGGQEIVPVLALVASRDEAPEIREVARVALDKLYIENKQN